MYDAIYLQIYKLYDSFIMYKFIEIHSIFNLSKFEF